MKATLGLEALDGFYVDECPSVIGVDVEIIAVGGVASEVGGFIVGQRVFGVRL